ncbi:MAG TPA: HEAT repeat domain-containing protein [Methylocella sp.]
MTVTMKEVRAYLDQDEPDYDAAAKLGPDALPHLLLLVTEGESGLASKATYLAATIGGDQSLAPIEQAAASNDPVVRVAAAGALGRLQQMPTAITQVLLGDPDPGVRYLSLQALKIRYPVGFKAKVREISQSDPNVDIRAIAMELVPRLP